MTNKKDDFTNLSPQERKELEKLLGIDGSQNADKKENDLGLLSFLQDETVRLKKLTDFSLNHLSIIEKHPQSDRISQEQAQLNDELKNKIIAVLISPNAEIHRNLDDLFFRQFGTIQEDKN